MSQKTAIYCFAKMKNFNFVSIDFESPWSFPLLDICTTHISVTENPWFVDLSTILVVSLNYGKRSVPSWRIILLKGLWFFLVSWIWSNMILIFIIKWHKAFEYFHGELFDTCTFSDNFKKLTSDRKSTLNKIFESYILFISPS